MGDLKSTFREVIVSTLPIAVVVLALQLFLLKPSAEDLILFLGCIALVLIGFTIFLYGVDWGINAVGESMGTEISRRKSSLFMIAVVSIISFLVTIAEPDVGVFAKQVTELFSSMDRNTLVYAIAV
ncbi:MAG: DUF1538 family protein, partial [Candidatus Methanomethylophilaceae archaeon]|nr:DUF1538 family protein [Candidatus Methanomethylophilaceae archaeon]